MTAINLISKEELKEAIREVLAENHLQRPATTTPETETYLHGLEALAAFLGIGITTAWKLSKTLPVYRSGKKMFFKKNEVLAALNQRRS